MDRLAVLKEFVARSPDDPFPRYGLAMELKGRGLLAEACQAFQDLVDKAPDYVPTYLMYGTTLASAGERARAKEILQTGADVAHRRGDAHARGEILAALADLDASD